MGENMWVEFSADITRVFFTPSGTAAYYSPHSQGGDGGGSAGGGSAGRDTRVNAQTCDGSHPQDGACMAEDSRIEFSIGQRKNGDLACISKKMLYICNIYC